MKYTSAVLLAAAAVVKADNAESYQQGGNWYIGQTGVNKIQYGDLNIAGSYRAVSNMDNSGACTYTDRPYSGPIAPYDEDLSLHFRGPLKLASVAVYTPSTGSAKRSAPSSNSKRHAHGHGHLHKKRAEEKRADMVTAVIDGITQVWENNWFGPTDAATDAAPAAADIEKTTVPAAAPTAAATTAAVASDSTESAADDVAVPVGDFKRVAYYSAADSVADGLVFLANKGDPTLSGTFDTVWGSSLSYVTADGNTCAAGPTVFAGDLADAAEIAIYSDVECDSSCGAYRPGSVAYKGFAGANKAFLFEFQMPSTGATGWNQDMPAIWALNGAIARTGQYSACSCWKGDNASPQAGGCGEADFFEVLDSGNTKAKSTFHFANALGDSHWFERPTTKTIKIAAIFQASSATATIKVLDDSFKFSPSLTSADIEALVSDATDSLLSSFMSFGSA